jgi:hypothetical protein
MHITNHYDVVHGCNILVCAIGKHEEKKIIVVKCFYEENPKMFLAKFISLTIP